MIRILEFCLVSHANVTYSPDDLHIRPDSQTFKRINVETQLFLAPMRVSLVVCLVIGVGPICIHW